ncbi:hypothetical protein JCM8097_005224 [Rhodosporidiobolus ruineniae]
MSATCSREDAQKHSRRLMDPVASAPKDEDDLLEVGEDESVNAREGSEVPVAPSPLAVVEPSPTLVRHYPFEVLEQIFSDPCLEHRDIAQYVKGFHLLLGCGADLHRTLTTRPALLALVEHLTIRVRRIVGSLNWAIENPLVVDEREEDPNFGYPVDRTEDREEAERAAGRDIDFPAMLPPFLSLLPRLNALHIVDASPNAEWRLDYCGLLSPLGFPGVTTLEIPYFDSVALPAFPALHDIRTNSITTFATRYGSGTLRGLTNVSLEGSKNEPQANAIFDNLTMSSRSTIHTLTIPFVPFEQRPNPPPNPMNPLWFHGPPVPVPQFAAPLALFTALHTLTLRLMPPFLYNNHPLTPQLPPNLRHLVLLDAGPRDRWGEAVSLPSDFFLTAPISLRTLRVDYTLFSPDILLSLLEDQIAAPNLERFDLVENYVHRRAHDEPSFYRRGWTKSDEKRLKRACKRRRVELGLFCSPEA